MLSKIHGHQCCRFGGRAPAAGEDSMEGHQLVCCNWWLINTQMLQGILVSVMMSIIVGINCLCLEPGDGVELLDLCRPQTRESAEDNTLDLSHLRILHSIHKSVLSPRCMVLQLICSILFAKRSNKSVCRILIGGTRLRCCRCCWCCCQCHRRLLRPGPPQATRSQ